MCSVQKEIKEKERAIETLSKRYGKRPPRNEKLPPTIMGEEEVRQVLYAVGDNHGTIPIPLTPTVLASNSSIAVMLQPTRPRLVLTVAYLRMNCEPVQRMRDMLLEHFKPNIVEKDFSLAISTGRNGARLTHNHARQFQYGNPPFSNLPLHVVVCVTNRQWINH